MPFPPCPLTCPLCLSVGSGHLTLRRSLSSSRFALRCSLSLASLSLCARGVTARLRRFPLLFLCFPYGPTPSRTCARAGRQHRNCPLALAPSDRSAKHPWPSPRAESPQLTLENSTCFIPPVTVAIARSRAMAAIGVVNSLLFCYLWLAARSRYHLIRTHLLRLLAFPMRVRRALDA